MSNEPPGKSNESEKLGTEKTVQKGVKDLISFLKKTVQRKLIDIVTFLSISLTFFGILYLISQSKVNLNLTPETVFVALVPVLLYLIWSERLEEIRFGGIEAKFENMMDKMEDMEKETQDAFNEIQDDLKQTRDEIAQFRSEQSSQEEDEEDSSENTYSQDIAFPEFTRAHHGSSTGTLIQTDDNGYAHVVEKEGYSKWGDSSVSQLIKTDVNGIKQWEQTYDSGTDDRGAGNRVTSIIQTDDGGYALAGRIYSTRSEPAAWLMKTDADGTQQWERTYGGSDDDVFPSDLIQTDDGGFVLAGTIEYGHKRHLWLGKTDVDGTQQWKTTFSVVDSGQVPLGAVALIQTDDSGYTLAGRKFYKGDYGEVWLVKINVDGYLQWKRIYSSDTGCGLLVQTDDGGYILGGEKIVKTDKHGTPQWGRIPRDRHGYPAIQTYHALIRTDDSGYAFAGIGENQVWLMKTDEEITQQWKKWLPVPAKVKLIRALIQTNDGGYALVGSKEPFSSFPYPSSVFLMKSPSEANLCDEALRDEDLKAVDGIGSVIAGRLRASGVETLSELVELNPEEVAEIVSMGEFYIPQSQTAEWLNQARILLKDLQA